MAPPIRATDPQSPLLAEEQYNELPDHVRRSIEVIDGHVVFLRFGFAEPDAP
ncbi:hypothetical protein [Actinocorallia longicatena]|uniref:Uncharacterized protein n=1 Tax=Actinocorallia longicatena TaxID=111803 RepID=A0ABP6QMU3_9ACTN